MDTSFKLDKRLSDDSIELADLPLCKLLLENDSNYPWFILVPKRAEITEIYQLDWQDQQQLLNESAVLGELLMTIFNGDKLNVAALGNVVEQLHVHHIVRFKNDAAWPAPVWGKVETKPYSKQQITELKEKLTEQLKLVFSLP